MRIAWFVAVAMVTSGPAFAQGTGTGAAAGAGKPVVAKRAEALISESGAYLASAAAFTFHADVTFDHVLPSGQKLQFSAVEDVALKRPDWLYVEWRGDLGDRFFWYDGKTVTLYDPATPFYATEVAPRTIDQMLDKLVSQLGFSPPLTDFLYSDPAASLRGKVKYGLDLGETEVNGKSCHALTFVEQDIDWQIWIAGGPQPLPCKIVITYKTEPAEPEFSAVFSDWDFSPHIDDSVFTADLPPDAQKIPFKSVASAR